VIGAEARGGNGFSLNDLSLMTYLTTKGAGRIAKKTERPNKEKDGERSGSENIY